MNKKGFWALALAVTMVIGNFGIAEAAETTDTSTDPLQEAIENLENGYSEYYDISGCRTILCSSTETDGIIENTYMLTMNAVLKVSSVEEMDYYQGMTAYYHSVINEDSAAAINGKYSQMRANHLSSRLSNIYEELNSYIGKESEFTFFIKETYPINDDSQKEILFENGPDYVSWEEMLPASHNELFENGYAAMASIDSDAMSMLDNAPSSPHSATNGHNRFNITHDRQRIPEHNLSQHQVCFPW